MGKAAAKKFAKASVVIGLVLTCNSILQPPMRPLGSMTDTHRRMHASNKELATMAPLSHWAYMLHEGGSPFNLELYRGRREASPALYRAAAMDFTMLSFSPTLASRIQSKQDGEKVPRVDLMMLLGSSFLHDYRQRETWQREASTRDRSGGGNLPRRHL